MPSKRDMPREVIDQDENAQQLTMTQAAVTGYGLDLAKLPTATAKALQATPAGDLLFGNYLLTRIGLRVQGQVTPQIWRSMGDFFKQSTSALLWWIGDWINSAPTEWGEMYTAAVEVTGMAKGRLQNVASVAARVDFSRRSEKLSFKHFEVLIRLVPERLEEWRDYAISKHLSTAKLETEILDKPTGKHARPERKAFSRIWRSLQKSERVRREDIVALRKWLDEIERMMPNEDTEA